MMTHTTGFYSEMANILAMYPQICIRFFQLVCVKLSKPAAPVEQNRIVSDVTIGEIGDICFNSNKMANSLLRSKASEVIEEASVAKEEFEVENRIED